MSKEKREHRTTSSNNKITVAKALELFNKSYDFSGMTAINKALEVFNKPYGLNEMTAINKALEPFNMPYALRGMTATNKALEVFNKSYDFSGMTAINKALEPFNMPYALRGMTATNKALEPFNKLYDFNRMTATYTVFETPSMGAFKNLVVPKEIMDKSFPYLNVSKIDVKNIFNGLSPSEYTLKNDIRENKVSSFIVKNETTDEIPVKSFVSTISSVDVLKSITKEEALSFYHHLSRYPMLGLEHEVGKKIFTEIQQIKVLTIQNKVLYRGRPRDPQKRAIPYSPDEMFSAPYGLSVQGRFNVVGQGELYTCDSKDVAIKECTKGTSTIVDVIELELIEKVHLIDLTDKVSPIVQYCSFSADTSHGLEYLVPNFIAQCAKSKGITGIVFSSTQNEDALNYVFFDYKKGWFEIKGLDVALGA